MASDLPTALQDRDIYTDLQRQTAGLKPPQEAGSQPSRGDSPGEDTVTVVSVTKPGFPGCDCPLKKKNPNSLAQEGGTPARLPATLGPPHSCQASATPNCPPQDRGAKVTQCRSWDSTLNSRPRSHVVYNTQILSRFRHQTEGLSMGHLMAGTHQSRSWSPGHMSPRLYLISLNLWAQHLPLLNVQ